MNTSYEYPDAAILRAVRDELNALFFGRLIEPNQPFSVRGKLVRLSVDRDQHHPERLRVRIVPEIQAYIDKEILAGVEEAIDRELNEATDSAAKSRQEHLKFSLRMPAPGLHVLSGLRLTAKVLGKGDAAASGMLVFDTDGTASLDLPSSAGCYIQLSVVQFTCQLVADEPAPLASARAGSSRLAGSTHGRSLRTRGGRGNWCATAQSALAAEPMVAATESVRKKVDNRRLDVYSSELECRFRAVPEAGGKKTVLSTESRRSDLHGKKLRFALGGQEYGATFCWKFDHCAGEILLDVPFEEIEALWPPKFLP